MHDGPTEEPDLATQANTLLEVILEAPNRVLTPAEAEAVVMLIDALRALIGEDEEENGPEAGSQP